MHSGTPFSNHSMKSPSSVDVVESTSVINVLSKYPSRGNVVSSIKVFE
jgi:hypothetical protein